MIDGIAGSRPFAPAPRPAPGRAGTPFQVRDTFKPGPAMVAGVPGSALGGMIALQEHEGDGVRDREAKRRGADLLAALRTLQRQLLGAGATKGHLGDLAALADSVPDAADAALRALVAAIVLRARIEIARYDADAQR